jgi:hypothetical protein
MLQHWLLRCPPPYPLCLTPPNKYPKLRSIIPPPSCFPIFHSTGRTGPRSHKSHSHFLALSPLSPSKDRQTGGRLAFVPYLPAYSLLLPLRPLPARGRSLSSRLSPTPTRQGPPLLPLLFSPLLPVRGHSYPSCSPPALSALALRSLPVRGHSCSSCLSPRIHPYPCDDPAHFCPLAPFALGRRTRGRFAPVPCHRSCSLFRFAPYPSGATPSPLAFLPTPTRQGPPLPPCLSFPSLPPPLLYHAQHWP